MSALDDFKGDEIQSLIKNPALVRRLGSKMQEGRIADPRFNADGYYGNEAWLRGEFTDDSVKSYDVEETILKSISAFDAGFADSMRPVSGNRHVKIYVSKQGWVKPFSNAHTSKGKAGKVTVRLISADSPLSKGGFVDIGSAKFISFLKQLKTILKSNKIPAVPSDATWSALYVACTLLPAQMMAAGYSVNSSTKEVIVAGHLNDYAPLKKAHDDRKYEKQVEVGKLGYARLVGAHRDQFTNSEEALNSYTSVGTARGQAKRKNGGQPMGTIFAPTKEGNCDVSVSGVGLTSMPRFRKTSYIRSDGPQAYCAPNSHVNMKSSAKAAQRWKNVPQAANASNLEEAFKAVGVTQESLDRYQAANDSKGKWEDAFDGQHYKKAPKWTGFA